jgi:hypothetical protein
VIKICSTCSKSLPFSSFHKKAQNKADGHTNVCKACCVAYSLKWRSENVDKLREDKARDYLENTASYKDRASKWKKDNRAEASSNSARRRAGNRSAAANHTDVRGMYLLARKLNKLTGSCLQVDHIEPLIHPHVCGLHTGVNLQLLSSKINATKSNRRDYLTPMDKLRNAEAKRRYPQTVTSG